MRCLLCNSADLRPLPGVAGRSYFRCAGCGLGFMHPDHWLDPQAERAIYCLHQNHPDDPRYRAFLSRLADPLTDVLAAGACGLDFGCGPGPTLSLILRQRGFFVREYDPFFAPDADALQHPYDFITCSETVEHFRQPAAEFARLEGLLRPGGWLGLMSQWLDDTDDRFANWGYVRDPTHICFYTRGTLHWIARRWGLQLSLPAAGIALLRKPDGQ